MDGIERGGLDWQLDAACRGADDPDLFFPDRSDLSAAALAVCTTCPVLAECRSHALDQPERFGVWGGLTERDRERLLKAQAARRRPARPSAWVGLRRRRIGA